MFNFRLDEDSELRLLEDRHAGELFALIDENRERLRPWMPWLTDGYSIANAKKYVQYGMKQFAEGRGFQAGIWSGGKLAGTIGFHGADLDNRRTTIGYWISAPFEGRGLVTRACRAMIDHAFDGLGANRVEIGCDVENLRSRAIPEKLGFKQEGVLRRCDWIHDHFVDIVIYSMLADEWRNPR